jgi:hypothetical protein
MGTHDADRPFDDVVLRAMAKWPNVPACYGWLALDRRGAWRIRGETISHARSIAFLGRHYRADDEGRWYVQNGPQRVFVDLAYTPWVYRYDSATGFTTHTGLAANDLARAFIDDEGNLLLATGVGIGVVDDRDLTAVSALIGTAAGGGEALSWNGARLPLEPIARGAVAGTFGFAPQPRPPA